MMRTSQPGWNEGAITLSASRMRRRTRFRIDGSTEPLAGRESEPGLVQVVPDEPSDQQGVASRDAALRQPGEVAGRESMTSRSGL